jgi:hypothetical protein
MLTNVALWIILIGMIAIIPCGCIMTRRPNKPPAAANNVADAAVDASQSRPITAK